MQRFIDAHTTVSIERTVLRAYGVDGADADGVPLVNTCVDRYNSAGLLGRGVAYCLGRALARGARRPARGRRGARLRRAARRRRGRRPPTRGARRARAAHRAPRSPASIARARRARSAASAPRHRARTPWKYVIVATGNIYDDADQARAAAQAGADIIAVIRSTAQSLIDYVPYGATTEGFGGTWATQENFKHRARRARRRAGEARPLPAAGNYSSGLCMPEIAYLGAVERLDMLLNDAMYGILFRDINPRRTLCDQYFSRRIIARAGIIINTGEDNYLTTADAVEKAHTVLASQFINEAFAHRAGLPDELMGLGHAFEIDKSHRGLVPDGDRAGAAGAPDLPQAPDQVDAGRPSTRSGDIFWSHRVDGLFDLVGVATEQSIELLGMMTESIHTPLLQDRFAALKGADYVFNAARHLVATRSAGIPTAASSRAREQVLGEARDLLREVQGRGHVRGDRARRVRRREAPRDRRPRPRRRGREGRGLREPDPRRARGQGR